MKKILDKILNILVLADRLPKDKDIDAIFVPGLGITRAKERLVAINRECMEEAVQWARNGTYFIYSGCHDGETMRCELVLRREIAITAGISKDLIHEILGVVNTKDELEKLRLKFKNLNTKNVLLVSDKYHMPRLVKWARLTMPDVDIYHKSVSPTKYEFIRESNFIRTLRSGIKPLWILWNIAGYIVTPFLFKKRQ